jgi:hypothetical protein
VPVSSARRSSWPASLSCGVGSKSLRVRAVVSRRVAYFPSSLCLAARLSLWLRFPYRFSTFFSLPPDLVTIDLPPLAILVAPFLSLIRSPLTTGPITSHALTALLSLLQIFPPASSIDEQSSQDLISALSEISSAVTSCKFEASDSQGDEVVLLKMLGVIGVVVDRYGGGGAGSVFLGDKEVCEMLETGLGMCCQMRLSGEPRSFLTCDAPLRLAIF